MNIRCYGCNGLGWVDSQYFGPSQCPICHGTGKIEDTDQGYEKNNENREDKPQTPAHPIVPLQPPPSHPYPNKVRNWAFCEAVDPDGSNIKRYNSSTECWRKETGLAINQGYQGLQNRDAVDSFRNQGWGVAFGDREHKERGMRVIRPRKI